MVTVYILSRQFSSNWGLNSLFQSSWSWILDLADFKIFQFQKLTFSAEAVLETSWALQSVDIPGENQIKIILCCPFKNMKPCAFSFLENTGDAPRGTPEVQNQPGEVFQSRCIWAIFHLELYLYFFSTGDLSPKFSHNRWPTTWSWGRASRWARSTSAHVTLSTRSWWGLFYFAMIWELFVVWWTHCSWLFNIEWWS